jgi:hypothetical protein
VADTVTLGGLVNNSGASFINPSISIFIFRLTW